MSHIAINLGNDQNASNAAYLASQNATDLAFLKGYTDHLRIAMPQGNATIPIANLKQLCLDAKAQGYYVSWGITAGQDSGVYQNQWQGPNGVLAIAAWCQANNIDELHLGNEEDWNCYANNAFTNIGKTPTSIRNDVKAMVAAVRAVYSGKLSYCTAEGMIPGWIAEGIGGLDKIYFNVYDDVADGTFQNNINAIVNAFGAKACLSEWNAQHGYDSTQYSHGSGSAFDTWYAQELLNHNTIIRNANIDIACFFTYRYPGSGWAALQSAGLVPGFANIFAGNVNTFSGGGTTTGGSGSTSSGSSGSGSSGSGSGSGGGSGSGSGSGGGVVQPITKRMLDIKTRTLLTPSRTIIGATRTLVSATTPQISVVEAQKVYSWYLGTLTTPAFTTPVAVGDTMVVYVHAGANGADVLSVTDNLGNSYQKVFQYSDTGSAGTDMEVWISTITNGGTITGVSATDNNADNLWWISAYHVTGLVGSNWLDQSGHSTRDGSGAALAVQLAGATAQTPELLLMATMAVGFTGSPMSVNSGWSNLQTNYDMTDSSAKGFLLATQLKVATTTDVFATTPNFTGTAANQFTSIMVALKGNAYARRVL